MTTDTPSSTASAKRKRKEEVKDFQPEREYEDLYDVSDGESDDHRKRFKDVDLAADPDLAMLDGRGSQPQTPTDALDKSDGNSTQLDVQIKDSELLVNNKIEMPLRPVSQDADGVRFPRPAALEDMMPQTAADLAKPSPSIDQPMSANKRAAAPATREEPIELDSDSEGDTDAASSDADNVFVDVPADDETHTDAEDEGDEQAATIGDRNALVARRRPEDYNIDVGEIFDRQYQPLGPGTGVDSEERSERNCCAMCERSLPIERSNLGHDGAMLRATT